MAPGASAAFGAWLLHAGRDVTFLVRPNSARLLKERGLILESKAGNLNLPDPPTVQAAALKDHFDLILLSCKSYDLLSAMNDFAPAVGPESVILPMLNGMAHMALLDERFGRRHVLGGDTLLSAARDEEGRILHFNPLDDVHLGDRDDPDGDRIHRIAETLTVPGFTTHLVPNIDHVMWQKWVAIATAAGSTCLMRAPIGDIVTAGAGEYIGALLEEAASVATAAGYPPGEPFMSFTHKRMTVANSLFTTSMHRDIEANAPVEAQQIIGDLLAHARQFNLQTPLLSLVDAHLRCYEQRRQREIEERGQVA